MPKRALVQKRPWLLASLTTAIAYYLLKDDNFPGTYLYGLEVASFFLLALYAVLRHQGSIARIVASVMVLAGIGVMAVELDPYIGSAVLTVANILAILIFLRSRRGALTQSQRLTALALLVLVPATAWLLSFDNQARFIVSAYGFVLGVMAAAAWTSRFTRYRVGIGAVLVVAAALVSIAGTGLLANSVLPGLFSWPFFYLGYFLICNGVVRAGHGEPA